MPFKWTSLINNYPFPEFQPKLTGEKICVLDVLMDSTLYLPNRVLAVKLNELVLTLAGSSTNNQPNGRPELSL